MTSLGSSPQAVALGGWCINAPTPWPLGWDKAEACVQPFPRDPTGYCDAVVYHGGWIKNTTVPGCLPFLVLLPRVSTAVSCYFPKKLVAWESHVRVCLGGEPKLRPGLNGWDASKEECLSLGCLPTQTVQLWGWDFSPYQSHVPHDQLENSGPN